MTTKPQCPYCHAHTPTDNAGRLIYHSIPCLGSGDDPLRPGPLVENASKAPQRPVETSEPPEAPTPGHEPEASQEGGEGPKCSMCVLCPEHVGVSQTCCPVCSRDMLLRERDELRMQNEHFRAALEREYGLLPDYPEDDPTPIDKAYREGKATCEDVWGKKAHGETNPYPPNTGLARAWNWGFQAEARVLRAIEAEMERDEARAELLTLRAEVDALRAERVAEKAKKKGATIITSQGFPWTPAGTGPLTSCPTIILSSDACGIECSSPGIYVAPEVCTDTCWPSTYPDREDGADCDGDWMPELRHDDFVGVCRAMTSEESAYLAAHPDSDGPGDPPAPKDCDEVNHG